MLLENEGLGNALNPTDGNPIVSVFIYVWSEITCG